MIHHFELGTDAAERKLQVRALIAEKRIQFGGNKKLKIYGELSCISGKKMKVETRVFFETEKDAVENGYRPCGRCLPGKYKRWKANHDKNYTQV